MHGEGADAVFPGTMESWFTESNDSSQDIIARFAIHASLHPEVSGGESFNTADNCLPSSWSVKWPIICEYFSLRGVAPTNGPGPDPHGFLSENRKEWSKMEKKYGLRTGHFGENSRSVVGLSSFIMTMFNFARRLNLDEMHQTWGMARKK
ncbi:hypothetical protein CNMCM8980_001949 [Aspergillus fumigatiaffinis]|jgi:hypothetical protein|nr:hypothetical protein CNMCM8980_001949 [Aspergillus fumigatiaffinis]